MPQFDSFIWFSLSFSTIATFQTFYYYLLIYVLAPFAEVQKTLIKLYSLKSLKSSIKTFIPLSISFGKSCLRRLNSTKSITVTPHTFLSDRLHSANVLINLIESKKVQFSKRSQKKKQETTNFQESLTIKDKNNVDKDFEKSHFVYLIKIRKENKKKKNKSKRKSKKKITKSSKSVKLKIRKIQKKQSIKQF